jgi:hypothetical protein
VQLKGSSRGETGKIEEEQLTKNTPQPKLLRPTTKICRDVVPDYRNTPRFRHCQTSAF